MNRFFIVLLITMSGYDLTRGQIIKDADGNIYSTVYYGEASMDGRKP